MSINRSLWHRLAQRDSLPSLPCPRCEAGKLKASKQKIKIKEPRYSVDEKDDHQYEWEPDWSVGRWAASLECDEAKCGEIVNLIGDSEWVEVDVSPGQWGLEEALRIQAVFPAPPLIRASKNVPKTVSSQLQLASQMFWTDVSTCVARLRTSVECLLDHQGVPKERMVKKGKGNKIHRMNLAERIDAFANGSSHKDQLRSLRHIGNLGTHATTTVDDEDLFDAIDVLEFVLTGIYDTQTINAKATKLKKK